MKIFHYLTLPTMSERGSPVDVEGVRGVLLDAGVLLRAELSPVAGVFNNDGGRTNALEYI